MNPSSSADRELEPKLQAQLIEINPRMNYKPELTSRGPKDYDEVFVTLPPKQGIRARVYLDRSCLFSKLPAVGNLLNMGNDA